MMKNMSMLPLGSIVELSGLEKKVMIISRLIGVNANGSQYIFDYGACLYPEGLIGDQAIHFNHGQIKEVVFEGFSDDDNELMLDIIGEVMENCQIEHGDPCEINRQLQAAETAI